MIKILLALFMLPAAAYEARGDGGMLPVPQGKVVIGTGRAKDGVPAAPREFTLSAYSIDLRPVSMSEFVSFLNTLLPRENGKIQASPDRQGIIGRLEPPEDIKKLVRAPSYWLVLGAEGFALNGLNGDEAAFNVTWEGADAYCRYAGKALPSEAQWEKACSSADRSYKITPKYEWTAEWYSADFFSKAGTLDPFNEASTGLKTSRGGADKRGRINCSARSGAGPLAAAVNRTFRCAAAR